MKIPAFIPSSATKKMQGCKIPLAFASKMLCRASKNFDNLCSTF